MIKHHRLLLIVFIALIAAFARPSVASAYCGVHQWRAEIAPKLLTAERISLIPDNIYELNNSGSSKLNDAIVEAEGADSTINACDEDGTKGPYIAQDLTRLQQSWGEVLRLRSDLAQIRYVKLGYNTPEGKGGLPSSSGLWSTECIPAYLAHERYEVAMQWNVTFSANPMKYPYASHIVGLWKGVAKELGMHLPPFGVPPKGYTNPFADHYASLLHRVADDLPTGKCGDVTSFEPGYP